MQARHRSQLLGDYRSTADLHKVLPQRGRVAAVLVSHTACAARQYNTQDTDVIHSLTSCVSFMLQQVSSNLRRHHREQAAAAGEGPHVSDDMVASCRIAWQQQIVVDLLGTLTSQQRLPAFGGVIKVDLQCCNRQGPASPGQGAVLLSCLISHLYHVTCWPSHCMLHIKPTSLGSYCTAVLILQAIYTEMKFERPSKIQATTLPMILRYAATSWHTLFNLVQPCILHMSLPACTGRPAIMPTSQS